MAGVETTGGVRDAVLRACLCAVLVAAGGCSKDSNAPPPVAAKPQTKLPAPVKSGPTTDQLTAGMVEAAVQGGKAGLALKLKFELAQRPKVGQPLEINLALIPRVAGGPLSIQVTASDGVVSAATESYELPSVEPGEVYRHTLRLTPAVEGVLFVPLTISLKHDEVTDSTGFSIPIIADK